MQKQLAKTFSHVLYLIHRDYLLEQDITITRTVASDFDSITELLESTPTAKDETPSSIMEQIRDATHSADTKWLAYSARVEDSVVATFVISKDVNLEYYKSHFHIQDQILMAEHERKACNSSLSKDVPYNNDNEEGRQRCCATPAHSKPAAHGDPSTAQG